MQNFETVWEFKTARFRVYLEVGQDHGYQYDGDDPDGETQRLLDDGAYVAFDSHVVVELDGVEVGDDWLGASAYAWTNISDFWAGHRDSDPNNRNCSLSGRNVGHYFPDMVREAIREARKQVANISTIKLRNGGALAYKRAINSELTLLNCIGRIQPC